MSGTSLSLPYRMPQPPAPLDEVLGAEGSAFRDDVARHSANLEMVDLNHDGGLNAVELARMNGAQIASAVFLGSDLGIVGALQPGALSVEDTATLMAQLPAQKLPEFLERIPFLCTAAQQDQFMSTLALHMPPSKFAQALAGLDALPKHRSVLEDLSSFVPDQPAILASSILDALPAVYAKQVVDLIDKAHSGFGERIRSQQHSSALPNPFPAPDAPAGTPPVNHKI
jgi:hypothetical protein